VRFDPVTDYPLGLRRPDLVSTPGGIPLAEVTLEAVRAGRIGGEEIRATPETQFEIVTDGQSLVLTPVRDAKHDKKFKESLEMVHKRFGRALKKLAE